MARDKSSGFTFLEVIIVILIGGTLAAVAIPKFVSFRQEAALAVEKQQAGAVKVGVDSYFIQSVTSNRSPRYPSTLDSASLNYVSSQNPFFTAVVATPGVTRNGWRKLSSAFYQGQSGMFYFYDPAAGTFSEREILSSDVLNLLKMSPQDITMALINQLGSQNTISFANGQKLIGGASVLTPTSGEPSLRGDDTNRTNFSSLSGNIQAQITGEYAGYANQVTFGYYSINPQNGQRVLHQIFNGPDATGANKNFNINPGDVAGFYFTTPQGSGYTYYTQQNLNPDNKEHLKSYENSAFRKITFGTEDLYGGGDGDFQDMIITISY
jgi:prepilin-type N-terminal cleavage/methylation domain-containing protein